MLRTPISLRDVALGQGIFISKRLRDDIWSLIVQNDLLTDSQSKKEKADGRLLDYIQQNSDLRGEIQTLTTEVDKTSALLKEQREVSLELHNIATQYQEKANSFNKVASQNETLTARVNNLEKHLARLAPRLEKYERSLITIRDSLPEIGDERGTL